MSTLLRAIVLVQAGIIGFFVYFLLQLSINDAYFDAWVQTQGLNGFFDFAGLLLGASTVISVASVFYEWKGGKGALAGSMGDGASVGSASPRTTRSKDSTATAPTQHETQRTTAPGPLINKLAGPGDTTIVIPKESPLNDWVRERGEQYNLVDHTRKPTREVPKLPASVDGEPGRQNTDNGGT